MATTQGLRPTNKKAPWLSGWEMGDIELMDSPATIVNSLGGGDSASAKFGIDPKALQGEFDANYDKASAGYTPFPGDHSKIDQLQSLYGTVGDAFDVSDTLSALGDSRRTNLLTGENAANTAARSFTETAAPGASSRVGANMVRAQSLLPFLNADHNAAAGDRKYADSAKQNALSQGADIAAKLAELQQNYTNSLASYNSNKSAHAFDYANSNADRSLRSSEIQMQSGSEYTRIGLEAARMSQENNRYQQQLQEADRQRQLALIESRRRTTSTPASTVGGLTYIGNSGGTPRSYLPGFGAF